MLHIRHPGMTSGGCPPSPGTDVLRMLVWLFPFSPFFPYIQEEEKGNQKQWFHPPSLIFYASHPNRWST